MKCYAIVSDISYFEPDLDEYLTRWRSEFWSLCLMFLPCVIVAAWNCKPCEIDLTAAEWIKAPEMIMWQHYLIWFRLGDYVFLSSFENEGFF